MFNKETFFAGTLPDSEIITFGNQKMKVFGFSSALVFGYSSSGEFIRKKKSNEQSMINLVISQCFSEDGTEKIFSQKDRPSLLKMGIPSLMKIINTVNRLTEFEKTPVANWLKEKYPDIHDEYQESQEPVKKATENFT